MKGKKAMRILSVTANALLLFAGSAISLAFSLSENFPAQGGNVGVGIFALITFLLLIVICIIEIASALRISSSTYHTALIAFFLVAYAAFYPDMFSFYESVGFLQIESAGKIATEISFIGAEFFLLLFFRYTYRIGGRKLPLYPLFVAAAIDLILFFFLFDSPFNIIAHLFFLCALLMYFIIFQVRSYFANADNAIFAFSSAIFFSCAGMHTANALYYSGFVPYIKGLSSAYFWACIVCFVCIYLTFFISIDRKASRAEDYQLQNERLKMKVLVGQIKPHFISNALTTIKSSYHGDMNKGDGALELFSEYMRKSLLMIDTEIIPFEEEMQNISHYVDFINMSRARPFNIIYNIDVTDFSVPAFSLQPFIENAVKYSKVDEKEDGYIMISTVAENDCAAIKITDNGVGFDLSQIKEGAHGINNSKERFKLLFNTEPVIRSILSVGTEVTIRIQRAREEKS